MKEYNIEVLKDAANRLLIFCSLSLFGNNFENLTLKEAARSTASTALASAKSAKLAADDAVTSAQEYLNIHPLIHPSIHPSIHLSIQYLLCVRHFAWS